MTWKRLWLISAVMTILLGAFHSAGTEMLKKTAGKAEEETFQEGQEENRPLAALTFDDGPSAEYTPRLLDGLKERNIKASFFLLGRNIPGNEEIVERMQEEGHLIGNHTYNHVQLSAISEAEAREEILKTNNIIYEITGNYPQYMRPPFGSWKKNLELCVEMIPVFWNIDTMDWKSQDVSSILNIVFAEAEDGAIILMHDEYETSVEAALQIADHLMKEGYEFVTADRLIVP
ncbi:MAG TPA: polysaccharide deacetylase family protein [Candidatus Blautia intestinipullorum]|nr:polysaccharide deacetylase family protein [Candidatus Blautia intestinipullorum]